jgi:hypothetical protein
VMLSESLWTPVRTRVSEGPVTVLSGLVWAPAIDAVKARQRVRNMKIRAKLGMVREQGWMV